MENGPFIDGLPMKNGFFSMAMLNNQRVYIYILYGQTLQTQNSYCSYIDYVCPWNGVRLQLLQTSACVYIDPCFETH